MQLSMGARQHVKHHPYWTTLVALLITTFTFTFSSTAAAASDTVRFYSATGHAVRGAFLKFHDTYGGIPIIGYPISDEVAENGRPVQYFERQRMEYHSELAGTPNEVQLSLLGTERAVGRVSLARIAPVAPNVDRIYVSETGHSLSYSFLKYWKTYGSIRVFGYPISEPLNENGYVVQYFQRARMEYHPEKSGISFGVELGHLGKEFLLAKTAGKGSAAGANQTAPQPMNPQATPDQGSRELMALINQARQSGGLAPVEIDAQISNVSIARSRDMATRNYFSHTTPEGTDFLQALKVNGISYKLAGEIIAMNNYAADKTVRAAYDTYINSPGHRAIIMDGHYNKAGVGMAKDAKGYFFYTVIFVQK